MKKAKIVSGVLLGSIILGISVSAASTNDAILISEIRESVTVMDEFGLDEPLSPGINVINYSSPLIITGATGKDISFSAEVFDSRDGCVPSSVQVLSLPPADSGTLICNSKPISAGDKISVLSINSLTYSPKCADDAEFLISTDGTTVTRCVIKQTDRTNTPPKSFSNETVATFTSIDTAVGGFLNGVDSDGDPVSFEIVSYPTRGILNVTDSSTGEFIFEPYEDVSGSDYFTYRIMDAYGKYSDTYTAKIEIADSAVQVFDDMSDSFYQAAAYDMVKSGIMGVNDSDSGKLFEPDKPVSRIDFLIMAMKTMGAGKADAVSDTLFADDNYLSAEEKGYLSAAYRLGIIKGSETENGLCFSPDREITGAEAAVILNSILGLPADDSVVVSAMGENVPAWAVGAMSALTGEGFINSHTAPTDGIITRENAAVILSGIKRSLS